MDENEMGSRPTPDPTVLTTESQARAQMAMRDYVDGQIEVIKTRLNAIDKATQLLNETVNRVPTALQEAITHLRELDEEKFASVAQQFNERDTRSERESRDNKVAVDAAFAAQKEAAAKQDESNAKAIDKSEAATTETINKLGELFSSSNKALSDKIDDLKARVGSIEANRQGGREVESDRNAGLTANSAVLYLIIAVVGIIVTIAVATHGFTR